MRQIFLKAKFPYGEISVRRNFLRRNFFTANFPYCELSLRRNLLTAKIPNGKLSYGEISAHGLIRKRLKWCYPDKCKAYHPLWKEDTESSVPKAAPRYLHNESTTLVSVNNLKYTTLIISGIGCRYWTQAVDHLLTSYLVNSS